MRIFALVAILGTALCSVVSPAFAAAPIDQGLAANAATPAKERVIVAHQRSYDVVILQNVVLPRLSLSDVGDRPADGLVSAWAAIAALDSLPFGIGTTSAAVGADTS